jgi:hypothetical protein
VGNVDTGDVVDRLICMYQVTILPLSRLQGKKADLGIELNFTRIHTDSRGNDLAVGQSDSSVSYSLNLDPGCPARFSLGIAVVKVDNERQHPRISMLGLVS